MVDERINSSIICLGGGSVARNLLKGLSTYYSNLTVVLSMADSGGSTGRLRRLYNIPLGNMVDCITALPNNNKIISALLTYRFPGDRYGKDYHLGGQKLGNLLLVALTHITGDFGKAMDEMRKIFGFQGDFLPATKPPVTISAITSEGKEIHGEDKIDLGQYKGKRIIQKVLLHPANAKAGDGVVDAILNAKAIICGPGDLYTTILPVLIVPEINRALKKTKAHKIFIVNVANKPFETKGYSAVNFIQAIEKHIGAFPFDTVIVNNNFTHDIPAKLKYTFVEFNPNEISKQIQVVQADVIDESYPLSHDPIKLAKVIKKLI